MLNTLPKRLFAGTLVALSIALPVAVSAAQTVAISATTGVANVTNGDTSYSSAVSASYNQIVKVQVEYTNDEAAGSSLVANNVTLKINLPTTTAKTQTVTSTVGGTNTNTVNGSAVVNLAQAGFLQYIPGSAQARITETDGTVTPVEVVPDGVITGSGYVINNGNPCQSAAVAIEARVMVPGVSMTKQVADLSQANPAWVTSDTANPGDTLQYLLSYENTGNVDENAVVIRDILPAGLTLVPNSTKLTDQSHPSGEILNDADGVVTGGGINVGEFGPTEPAYITFKVTVPAVAQLACGENTFTNVALATPQGMGQYSGMATTTVNKTCSTPSTPTYACTSLGVTTSGKTATISNFQESAANGATFNGATINWGDGATTPSTKDVKGQTHTYADGTWTITATANFTVNGASKSVSSTGCTQTVSFTTPPTTPPTITPPTTLVNTGPGDVIGIVGLVTIAGAIAHNLFLRRFARR
ncbi:MAG: DUF11 domain-containing protein [Candidatus Saccharimonadales bacterium]